MSTPSNSPRRGAIGRYEARILAYEDRAPATPRPSRPATPRRAREVRPPRRTQRVPRRVAPRVRMRRIALLTCLLLLVLMMGSFSLSMMQSSNVAFGVRAVEWLRENGAAWLVSDIESIYYSLNAPSKGGPRLKRLPKVGGAAAGKVSRDAPAPVPPVITPALTGEGQWRSTGPVVRGASPVLVTTFRPDPSYPQLVAGVAWIDSTRSSIALYPGRYEPPNAANPTGEVPPSLRSSMLATFNSGFRLQDAAGSGYVADGHVYAPLKDGKATLIAYRNGTVDVRAWSGGPDQGPEVVFARQNLPLILEGGRLNPSLSNDSLWGATLGNAIRVWRSAVGVDAHGNLMYAAANDQNADSLARILQHAGAVRAMELDINYEWVTFNFYGTFGAGQPTKLLQGMDRPPIRYLTPDDRDFFAVFAR